MPWVPKEIRQTFPIPAEEVSRRKWKLALSHPITWLPAIPLAMAAMNAQPGMIGWIGAGAAALAAGLGFFWSRKSKSLEGKIVEQIVRDSNMAQDSALIRLIRKLSRNGYQSYAVTLGSFAGLKTKIERALYEEGQHDDQREQVGKLVDGLVFNVVDQLEQMAKIEYRLNHKGRPAPPPQRARELEKSWEVMSGRVKTAYATLRDTWHNLDVLINPTPEVDTTGDRLDDTIAQLKEENRIAEEVRRRFQADAKANESLPADDAADAEIASTFAGLKEDEA